MSDKGTYAGFTYGFPLLGGLGGGFYIDNSGRLYPQFYYGTPRFGASAGYTNDLGALLTGPSAAGSFGRGWVKGNVATVGTESGVGFGTPGAGVTWGFGPFEPSKDYSQPWTKSLIGDSANRAGIPSRNNVSEYDFPEPRREQATEPQTSDAPGSPASGSASAVRPDDVRRLTRMNASSAGSVAPPGHVPPIGFTGPQAKVPFDPSTQPAGGLLGMIEDYMRNNGY